MNYNVLCVIKSGMNIQGRKPIRNFDNYINGFPQAKATVSIDCQILNIFVNIQIWFFFQTAKLDTSFYHLSISFF